MLHEVRFHLGRLLSLALLTVAASSCSQQAASREAGQVVEIDRTGKEVLVLSHSVALKDGDASVLARPRGFAVLTQGNVAIGDYSDLDIKVYDSEGLRVGTIGRAGDGPGEFRSLRGISALADSLVVYDFGKLAFTMVDPEGGFVRTIVSSPAPFESRIVEDSLLLQIAHPGQGQPLISLATLDGAVIRSFLEPSWLADHQPLRMHTGAFADVRDGLVHAAVFGGDLVYTFDGYGQTVAVRRLPGIDSIVDRWNSAGEQLQSADGTWFHHGLVAIMGILALPGGSVLVTVAEYDTVHGTDLLEGGFAIVLPPPDVDAPAVQTAITGQPMGLADDGDLFVLGYEDYSAGTYRLERWRWSALAGM